MGSHLWLLQVDHLVLTNCQCLVFRKGKPSRMARHASQEVAQVAEKIFTKILVEKFRCLARWMKLLCLAMLATP